MGRATVMERSNLLSFLDRRGQVFTAKLFQYVTGRDVGHTDVNCRHETNWLWGLDEEDGSRGNVANVALSKIGSSAVRTFRSAETCNGRL